MRAASSARTSSSRGAAASAASASGPTSPPGDFRQRFYVIGGHDVDIAVFPDNEARNWILELSPETNAWRRIPNDIPGRSVGGIKAATVGNKIYMMGGFDPDFTNLTNQVF